MAILKQHTPSLVKRGFSATRLYMFGFNGQEKDDEIFNVTGSSYTAEFWQYDSRLGRRWNLDPKPNSSISQYAAFSLNPILIADPLGDIGVFRGRKYTISTDDKGNVSYKFGRKGKSLSEMSKRFQKKFNKSVNPIYQAMAKSTSGRKDIDFINSFRNKINLHIDFDNFDKNANSKVSKKKALFHLKGTYYIIPLEKSLKRSNLPYNISMSGTIFVELLHIKNKDVEFLDKIYYKNHQLWKKYQTPGNKEYNTLYRPLLYKVTNYLIEYNNQNKLNISNWKLTAPLKKLGGTERHDKFKQIATPREYSMWIGKI